jgi:membrane-bound inhibitor of C-type lysozyme
MRVSIVLPILAACALFACSRSEDSSTTAAPGDEGAAAPAEAAAQAGGTQVATAYVGHDYTCSDGVTFNARLDKGNTLVTLEGKTLTLAPVAGAVEAQYAGEDVLFIARGNEASLMRGSGPLVTCKAN